MPATQSDPPTLPASAEEVKDMDSFVVIMNKLTTCVNTAISEGKSVTAANKRLISLAMEEIRRSTRTLNTLISSPTPPSLGVLKEELLSCVKKEMADFKKMVTAAQPRSSYAQAAAATCGSRTPAINKPFVTSTPPVTKPAIIVSSTEQLKTPEEVIKKFKSNISYRKSNYAPARIQRVSNNKLRVEFDNTQQRDDTLSRLEKSSEVKAEPVRSLRPMVILKGISKDVPAEDLVTIIRHQNPELAEIANNSIDINDGYLSLRFKRNNRNENLYNAVFLVGPKMYRKMLDIGRVCIDHQRIHLENFSPFLQCHKCLQFGHMKTRCTSQESFCSHCASNEHQLSDCPMKNNPNNAKCHNCHSHNTKFNAKADIKHPANSDSCPRLRAMKNRIVNRVDYGST